VTSSRAVELLSAPFGLQILELISERQAEVLTDDDLDRLRAELHVHISRYDGEYEREVAELRSRAGHLAGVAEWLTRRMPSWWADLDRTHQVWVGAVERPTPTGLVVDLAPFGHGTPKPRRALWTCTHIFTIISPWLESPEKLTRGPEGIWMITVSPEARVAEIHCSSDWEKLARAYPSPHQVNAPDWSKVAADWDGVHLSAGGSLTTDELRDWDVESTVWFRWVFSSVSALPPARSS
jgi:hypothetical protein